MIRFSYTLGVQMISEAELLASHAGKCELNEATYVETRTLIERRLSKAMSIRGALDSYELKLKKAVLELDQELKTIEQNYQTKDGT